MPSTEVDVPVSFIQRLPLIERYLCAPIIKRTGDVNLLPTTGPADDGGSCLRASFYQVVQVRSELFFSRSLEHISPISGGIPWQWSCVVKGQNKSSTLDSGPWVLKMFGSSVLSTILLLGSWSLWPPLSERWALAPWRSPATRSLVLPIVLQLLIILLESVSAI